MMVVAAAVAPVVQASTLQWTCLPRSLLACAAVTSTQRAARAEVGALLAVVVGSAVLVGSGDVDGSGDVVGSVVAVGSAVVVGAGLAGGRLAVGEVAGSVGVALFDSLVVLEGLAVAALDVAVVAECVGVADVL